MSDENFPEWVIADQGLINIRRVSAIYLTSDTTIGFSGEGSDGLGSITFDSKPDRNKYVSKLSVHLGAASKGDLIGSATTLDDLLD